MKFSTYANTDIGRVRPENEDSFLCNDVLGIYAVADGIGGLPSGGQASQLAVTALQKIVSESWSCLSVISTHTHSSSQRRRV